MVEDNISLLNLYSAFLKTQGDEVVVTCTSGEEIVDAAKAGKLDAIDVLIMDYRLKNMDGFQAAREVLTINPRIMIIIASADESIRGEALAAGFKFLLKPFGRRDLIAVLGE